MDSKNLEEERKGFTIYRNGNPAGFILIHKARQTLLRFYNFLTAM